MPGFDSQEVSRGSRFEEGVGCNTVDDLNPALPIIRNIPMFP